MNSEPGAAMKVSQDFSADARGAGRMTPGATLYLLDDPAHDFSLGGSRKHIEADPSVTVFVFN
jgi:hypothetical protein